MTNPVAETWSNIGGGGQAYCFDKIMSYFPVVLEPKECCLPKYWVTAPSPPGVCHWTNQYVSAIYVAVNMYPIEQIMYIIKNLSLRQIPLILLLFS